LARKNKPDPGPDWPYDAEGSMVPPTFLKRVHGGPLDMELTLNLLNAYGIPFVCEYPNNGLFGKLILGYSPGGMDVYVPESMLEDAQNVLNADILEDDYVLTDEIDDDGGSDAFLGNGENGDGANGGGANGDGERIDELPAGIAGDGGVSPGEEE